MLLAGRVSKRLFPFTNGSRDRARVRPLTRVIHEDSHQNAGSAACGSLQVISARSHALRDSGRANPAWGRKA